MKAAMGGGSGGQPDEAVDVAGVKLVAREVSGLDKDGLRALVDQHRDRIKSGVVVLAAPVDGKVAIVVGVTPDLTKKVPAGQVVKQLAPIVGGGGGGRPDFAEAGGKDPSKSGRAAGRGPGHRRETAVQNVTTTTRRPRGTRSGVQFVPLATVVAFVVQDPRSERPPNESRSAAAACIAESAYQRNVRPPTARQ